ncbi:MAG: hypothetical protein ACPGLV_03915 [Bacteroidia bacterium]
MKKFLFSLIFIVGINSLFGQASFEMGYIHPLLNQSFSTQLNSSPEREHTIIKYLSHTWFGIFANFNQRYSFNFTYDIANFDVRYSNAFLLELPEIRDELINRQLSHQANWSTFHFHLSLEKNYYKKNNYTFWLGIGLSFTENPWLNSRSYILGEKEREIGDETFSTYNSRLLVGKVGHFYVVPITAYANHKFIFKKREICIKTGIQLITPQKLEVLANNEYPFTTEVNNLEIKVPGSVMIYTSIQLNRVLRFRNFGSRAKEAIENSLWLLPKKLDEPYE